MNFIIRFAILTIFLILFVVFFQGDKGYILIHTPLNSLDGYKPFVLFMLALTLLNMFLKPILKLLSLPLTCITLGLFGLVINLIVVMLADYLVDGFQFKDWISAFVFSIAFSLLNSLVEYFQKSDD